MLDSKDITRIVLHFMLPQSYKTFGIREAPAPLLPHVLAGPKVVHPRLCKHDVVSDLLTLVSYASVYHDFFGMSNDIYGRCARSTTFMDAMPEDSQR